MLGFIYRDSLICTFGAICADANLDISTNSELSDTTPAPETIWTSVFAMPLAAFGSAIPAAVLAYDIKSCGKKDKTGRK